MSGATRRDAGLPLLAPRMMRTTCALCRRRRCAGKYGSTAEGFLEFARDAVAAMRNCTDSFDPLRCALLFETLSLREEKVFYHCDQLLRGAPPAGAPRALALLTSLRLPSLTAVDDGAAALGRRMCRGGGGCLTCRPRHCLPAACRRVLCVRGGAAALLPAGRAAAAPQRGALCRLPRRRGARGAARGPGARVAGAGAGLGEQVRHPKVRREAGTVRGWGKRLAQGGKRVCCFA